MRQYAFTCFFNTEKFFLQRDHVHVDCQNIDKERAREIAQNDYVDEDYPAIACVLDFN